MTQSTLQFFAKDAERWAKKLDRVIVQLLDGQWHTAKALGLIIGINDRTLRRLADLSDGRILGSDLGYKLTRLATGEEIDHAEARLLSQARKMTERAVEIRRARNSNGRAA